MREKSHLTSLYHLKPVQHSVKVLKGEELGHENRQLAMEILANKNPYQLIVL